MIIDVDNFLPDGFEEDSEYESLSKKVLKKTKPETLEEKLRRWESYRKHELVTILQGRAPETHPSRIYALLINGAHFTAEEGRQAQDVYLDAARNTALHYALDPQIRGRLTDLELINALMSTNLLEVMACYPNPHLPNVHGVTALDLVREFDVARVLYKKTRTNRPEIFDPVAFGQMFDRLTNQPKAW